MANRTGIELLPDVCRIVEIGTGVRAFGGGAPGGARVRVFHEFPYAAGNALSLTAAIRKVMKGLERRATVAVWGLRSTHQALTLPPAAPADLEVMARREVRAGSGNTPPEALADGVGIGEMSGEGRREVGYVSVPAEEMRSRLQPLVDAGLLIDSAVTPALAHASLVRQRRAPLPEAVIAVLSVNAHATALTLVRGSVVLFARELPWGDESEPLEQAGAASAPAAFAARLASELRRSLVYLRQSHKVEVSQVLVCGDVPDVRALTAPLMHELGLEVETLDVADDLDLSRLPEPSDRFRSRIGAWRTALALVTSAAPMVNLNPRAIGTLRASGRLPRRLGVAMAAGLLMTAVGWGLVTYLAVKATADEQRLRRLVGVLEPELQRQDEDRRNIALGAARQSAMRAFRSQGPRLARALEEFSRATPADLSLTGLTIDPGVGAWRITAEGQAEGANAAAAQATFNAFLKALNSSPLFGRPVTPPALRIRTEDPAAMKEPASAEPLPVPPARPPQELETRRPAAAGPAYIEVARDGRLYRIPLRRQAGDVEFDRQAELRRRQQLQAAGRHLTPGNQAPTGSAEPPERHPASVLDFTVQYEVRK